MDEQTTIAAVHGNIAYLPAEATSTSTMILRTATPEFFQFCEFCKLPFGEYELLTGRFVQFCSFCGSRLLRVMSIEDRVLPSNVQSAHPARVVDIMINQHSRPPPSRVESSNIGHSWKPYPSPRHARSSSPADERLDALDRSSVATHNNPFAQGSTGRPRRLGPKKRRNTSDTWKPPYSTSPSVQSTNEPVLEPACTLSAQPLPTLQDASLITGPVAKPAAGSMALPSRPAISSDSSRQQQNRLSHLPKYDFSRWQPYQTGRPTQPAPVRTRGRGLWTPIMERENMSVFQRLSIPRKAKKLEKRAEKLRQQIRAKEFANLWLDFKEKNRKRETHKDRLGVR